MESFSAGFSSFFYYCFPNYLPGFEHLKTLCALNHFFMCLEIAAIVHLYFFHLFVWKRKRNIRNRVCAVHYKDLQQTGFENILESFHNELNICHKNEL